MNNNLCIITKLRIELPRYIEIIYCREADEQKSIAWCPGQSDFLGSVQLALVVADSGWPKRTSPRLVIGCFHFHSVFHWGFVFRASMA